MPQDIELCDLGKTSDLIPQQMGRDGRVYRDLRHLCLWQGIALPARSRLLEDKILTVHQSLNTLHRI